MTDTDSSLSPLQRIMEAARMLETGAYRPGALRDLESGDEDLAQLARTMEATARALAQGSHQLSLLKRIIPVGVALSAEKDFNRLLEAVVVEAQFVTNADAGSLYLSEGDALKFVIARNSSLKLAMGGTSGNPIAFPPVALYKTDGSENRANVASYVALTHKAIRIADAYEAEGFDFSGTKAFDAQTGYRSQSFLAMPLINAEGKIIGVLQLINAQDRQTGEIAPFQDDEALDSLILLATAALDGYIREESLRHEIAQLKIEIDQARRTKQLAEITETAYFKDLQKQAAQARERKPKNAPK